MDTGVFEEVPEFSSDLNLNRTIHSAYTQWSGKIGGWALGGGLRLEQMHRTLDYLSAVEGSSKQVLTYDGKKYDNGLPDMEWKDGKVKE